MADNIPYKPHVIGLDVYLKIGLTLIVLTAVTVLVSFIDLGAWNVVVALFIAAIKASLVILFFMHLYYDNKLYLIVFLVAILFLAIFIGFIMFDTLNRGDIDSSIEKPINPNAAMYDRQNENLVDTSSIIDSLAVPRTDSTE